MLRPGVAHSGGTPADSWVLHGPWVDLSYFSSQRSCGKDARPEASNAGMYEEHDSARQYIGSPSEEQNSDFTEGNEKNDPQEL